MTTNPVQIRSVDWRQPGRDAFALIETQDGERFSSRNVWQVALCQRAMETQQPIRIWFTAGWAYKEIRHVAFEETTRELPF